MGNIKDINNMENFTELFLSLYFIECSSKTSYIEFSKYFKEIIDIILNKRKYKKILSENLYNEDGAFNIDEFLLDISKSNLKKYIKDGYDYNLLYEVIITEPNMDKAFNTLADYKIEDNIMISKIVQDYIYSQIYFPDRSKSLPDEYYDDTKLFANLFLSKYYIETKQNEKIAKFSKYFKEIFNNIINSSNYKDLFSHKFNIDEFLLNLYQSNIRDAWASSWQIDITNDTIYTTINDELAYLYYKKYNGNIKNIDNIVYEYINEEENSKKLKLYN